MILQDMILPPSLPLTDDEPLGRGVRRVVGEQVALAAEGLRGTSAEGLEAGVHEARRAFKKIRAALRLVRHGMPDATFTRENRFFRDSGRALSPLRDADVLVATVGALGRMPGEGPARPGRTRRRRLLDRRDRLRDALPEGQGPAELVPSLEAAARRVRRWRITGAEADVALHGLGVAYKKGRNAMARAFASGKGGPLFHEWRKRVKDLRYQLELLQGLWPAVQDVVADETHRLTDFLGEANDFDVLAAALRQEPDLVRGLRAPEALQRRARFHRDRLSSEARPLGARLYAETPETFLDRYRALWSIWRG